MLAKLSSLVSNIADVLRTTEIARKKGLLKGIGGKSGRWREEKRKKETKKEGARKEEK